VLKAVDDYTLATFRSIDEACKLINPNFDMKMATILVMGNAPLKHLKGLIRDNPLVGALPSSAHLLQLPHPVSSIDPTHAIELKRAKKADEVSESFFHSHALILTLKLLQALSNHIPMFSLALSLIVVLNSSLALPRNHRI
jgi:hypothetical protein